MPVPQNKMMQLTLIQQQATQQCPPLRPLGCLFQKKGSIVKEMSVLV